MDKRGASHIDWVISIGIFIVYVLLLLVWIKPGYEPVFEQEILVNIIKNNIEKDHGFEVFKTLVVADNCGAANGYYTFDLDTNNFKAIKLSDGVEVGHRPNGDIEIYSTGKNEYWVISSDDFNYNPNPGPLGTLTSVECASVSVGESVVKKGLSGFSLPGFNAGDWGFPTSREFKIVLTDFGGGDVCYGKTGSVNCETFEPDNNVPVYSNEWRYKIVDVNGNLEPVLVTILIW